MTTEDQPVTYDAVLRLALRLPPAERARLSTALAPDEAQERAVQREKNQAAIGRLVQTLMKKAKIGMMFCAHWRSRSHRMNSASEKQNAINRVRLFL